MKQTSPHIAFHILFFLLHLHKPFADSRSKSTCLVWHVPVSRAFHIIINSENTEPDVVNIALCIAAYCRSNPDLTGEDIPRLRIRAQTYLRKYSNLFVYMDDLSIIDDMVNIDIHDNTPLTKNILLPKNKTVRRRCPNGQRRVPAGIGECVNANVDKPVKTKRGRCPNGQHRIPSGTGECIPIISGGSNIMRLNDTPFTATLLRKLTNPNIKQYYDNIHIKIEKIHTVNSIFWDKCIDNPDSMAQEIPEQMTQGEWASLILSFIPDIAYSSHTLDPIIRALINALTEKRMGTNIVQQMVRILSLTTQIRDPVGCSGKFG